VFSRGFEDVDLPCSEGGIYVRADAVLGWIEEEIGLQLDGPACGQVAAAVPDIPTMSYEVGVFGPAAGLAGALPLVLAGMFLTSPRSSSLTVSVHRLRLHRHQAAKAVKGTRKGTQSTVASLPIQPNSKSQSENGKKSR
jgi:hypothetical protein